MFGFGSPGLGLVVWVSWFGSPVCGLGVLCDYHRATVNILHSGCYNRATIKILHSRCCVSNRTTVKILFYITRYFKVYFINMDELFFSLVDYMEEKI